MQLYLKITARWSLRRKVHVSCSLLSATASRTDFHDGFNILTFVYIFLTQFKKANFLQEFEINQLQCSRFKDTIMADCKQLMRYSYLLHGALNSITKESPFCTRIMSAIRENNWFTLLAVHISRNGYQSCSRLLSYRACSPNFPLASIHQSHA